MSNATTLTKVSVSIAMDDAIMSTPAINKRKWATEKNTCTIK